MRVKFNLSYQQENENTGNIDKQVSTDIYIYSNDDTALALMTDGIVNTCNSMVAYLDGGEDV